MAVVILNGVGGREGKNKKPDTVGAIKEYRNKCAGKSE